MSSKFRIDGEIKPDEMYFGTLRWISHPSSTGAEQLTVIDVTIAPAQAHSFHKHPDQEEVIFVLTGKLEQWVDREMRVLGPGDAAFIPAGMVHGSYNSGEEQVRMIVIFGPSVGNQGFKSEEVAGEAPWNGLRP